MTVIALALLAAALAWACLERGPWYDEFYTQYVARPDLPWGAALRESWLADNHPPLYYALARASAWLGAIGPHRLVNLAFGGAAVAGCLAIVRDVPRLAPAATALALAAAANLWTMIAGSELRSYFLSLCAGAVLALALCAIRIAGGGGSPARRAVYWIAALLGFNTHIVTSLTCAALLAPFLAAALLRRDWREARAIALAPLVAGLVLVAVTAIQLPIWLANTATFWIEAGFGPARWAVEWAMIRTLEANPVLLLGALAGGVLLARDVVRRKPSGEAGALVLLVCGVVIALAGLVALHLLRPMLLEKYLMAAVAAVMVGISLAFGRLLASLGPRLQAGVLVLALGLSVVALVHNARQAADHVSWFASGRAVAAQVARCPGTVVHADSFWNDDVTVLLPVDNARVVPWSYAYVAKAQGFTLAPQGSHAMARACPTVFWGEKDSSHRWDAAKVAARLRAAGYPAAPLAFERIGDGWIAVAPPARR